VNAVMDDRGKRRGDRVLDLDRATRRDDRRCQQCHDVTGADRSTRGHGRPTDGTGATCRGSAACATAGCRTSTAQPEQMSDEADGSEDRHERAQLRAHAADLDAELAAVRAVAHVAAGHAGGADAAVVRAEQRLADLLARGFARVDGLNVTAGTETSSALDISAYDMPPSSRISSAERWAEGRRRMSSSSRRIDSRRSTSAVGSCKGIRTSAINSGGGGPGRRS